MWPDKSFIEISINYEQILDFPYISLKSTGNVAAYSSKFY